jgi:hypothetical protein
MTTGAGHRRAWPRAKPVTVRPTRLLLVVVLGVALGLSGCSGGSDGPTSSSPSPSPSAAHSTPASPSASPAAEKVPRAPKAVRGRTGQKTFARHVMALWGYGLRTNDPRPLVSLSPRTKPCRGCTAFAASLRKRHKQGWYVDFVDVSVGKLSVKKVGDNTYAKAKVDIPESDSYNFDGSFRNTNRAHRGATFEVLMHYRAKRYRLLAFTVS